MQWSNLKQWALKLVVRRGLGKCNSIQTEKRVLDLLGNVASVSTIRLNVASLKDQIHLCLSLNIPALYLMCSKKIGCLKKGLQRL